jgi:alpha-galactosidase
MAKITLIGAGSFVFTRNLCNDILLTPCLQDSQIFLMDIDPTRLEQARMLVQSIIDQRQLNATVSASLDRREAIRGARYVITTFQQGGLDAFTIDITTPLKYGIAQTVGDTLGPGGIFRALRTIPILIDICHEMDELAPEALLINYVNPMAANCWGTYDATGRPVVGLCHSVQGTGKMLAQWINVPYKDIIFLCAGINHNAYFLEFRRGDEDLYPLLWKAIERPEVEAQEPIRTEVMRHFGYFVTESSAHTSEYLPYFRKNLQMVEKDLLPRFRAPIHSWCYFGETGGYLHECQRRAGVQEQEFRDLIDGVEELPSSRSHEYGIRIIEAVESNQPAKINGNVPNDGIITNLPDRCCVEVPCLVDGNGIQPTRIGHLPNQLAGLIRTNVSVQELIVDAAITRNKESIYHAAMLDPLTSAVCTLDQIRDLVDEMVAQQSQWLPKFS